MIWPKIIVSSDKLLALSPTAGHVDVVKDVVSDNIYFCGLNFRSPSGLLKYRQDLHNFFRPRNELINDVEKVFCELRKRPEQIVGVHVCHGDYRTFCNEKYYFNFQEVREIINDFLLY